MANKSQDEAVDSVDVAIDDPALVVEVADEEQVTGYIRDYISGRQVRATPEEVEAVQVFFSASR